MTTEVIRSKSRLFKIGNTTIVRLPRDASDKLPSRGQVMVEGLFNGAHFETPLEPDGNFRHWFEVSEKLLKETGTKVGAIVDLEIELVKHWPDPEVPQDLKKAVAASPKATSLWAQITPMARWEWVRWTRSTNSAETRARRVRVAVSKMEQGKRRPCCWNRNLCTVPEVSKNGILLEAATVNA